jgi:hypothetical protein
VRFAVKRWIRTSQRLKRATMTKLLRAPGLIVTTPR